MRSSPLLMADHTMLVVAHTDCLVDHSFPTEAGKIAILRGQLVVWVVRVEVLDLRHLDKPDPEQKTYLNFESVHLRMNAVAAVEADTKPEAETVERQPELSLVADQLTCLNSTLSCSKLVNL